MKTVTIKDIEKSFGDKAENFSENLLNTIKSINLNYQTIENKDLEKLHIEILEKLFLDRQKIGALERTEIWEKGWEENLNKFINNPNDESALIPRFIRPGLPIRFFQKFIKPENKMFELDYFRIYRLWLFEKYFKNYENIYEFGCGTGFNLLEGARLFKNKNFFGSDFVESSVKLVNSLAKNYNLSNLEAEKFNFIEPNYNYKILNNSLVCTFGALEQINSNFIPFIDFLRTKKPNIIIHTEPVKELYDHNNYNDYTAHLFHTKRGYTEGLLPYIRKMENDGEIEILNIKRLFFGSLMMEGFNLIIWKFK